MSAVLTAPLDQLEAIRLDELVEAAALQTRIDRKYALRRRDAEAVLHELASDTRVLETGGSRQSAYESVYFDTPELTSYRLAATGRRRRFKLRTRSYLDSDTAFLEVKTRGSRDATVKDRIPYAIDERHTLTDEGRDYVTTAIARLGIDRQRILCTPLMPVLTTEYLRTTLYQPQSASRATVDTQLAWQLEAGTRLELPELVIIETKSGMRTSEVDRLLWSHGHRPATISKYGTGLAALRPELPSNKWARVLRRHFLPATQLAASTHSPS